MKIYLAGPITDIPNLNLDEFRKYEKLLKEKGFQVVVPHDLFKDMDTTDFHWEDYMKICLPAMMACERVITLNDWHKSKGTKLEVYNARELNIPVEPIVNYL